MSKVFRGLNLHESTSLRFHAYYDLVTIHESLFAEKNRKSCEELKWGRQYHKRGENMGSLKFKNLMYYTNDTLHVQSHCNFRVYDMTSHFVRGVYVRGTCGLIISTKNNIVHNHPMTWYEILGDYYGKCYKFIIWRPHINSRIYKKRKRL